MTAKPVRVPRWRWGVLILVLWAALGLRLHRLDYQDIWWDEARNIDVATRPLGEVATAPELDIHPPLYFYTLHAWTRLAGDSPFATRFLSVWFGLLTVALTYQLGRRLAPGLGWTAGTLALMLAALSVFALVAAADYAWQRASFMKRMRMSRKDVRDELKNTEGDPQIRSRLRQIRAERSRQRMMQAVPKASVVIVNPTHYAVALRYAPDETPAPVCVAKGVDALALRIKAVAKAADVPIVEDAPLARALYASTEVDHEIRTEHFKAVAKIIGYVMGLAGQRRK